MNHGITEGLKKSLADLRGQEERCRDAALAIQRVLEAEWALYPEAVIQVASGAKITILESKPDTVQGRPLVVTKGGPRTWPRTCVICGKDYAALLSARSKCCSAACVEERNRRHANAKYQAKAGKPAPKTAAPKTPTGYQKVCVVCNKPFTPSRKDQKCCSTYCGKRRYLAVKPAVKTTPTQRTAETAVPTQAPTGRLDRIRMLAGADPIPQRVRDAAAEARESENMGNKKTGGGGC